VAAHDLYVSPITYIPYHEAPAFTDEMDSLLHHAIGKIRIFCLDRVAHQVLVVHVGVRAYANLIDHIFKTKLVLA